MTTYIEKSKELALSASIAVMVLTNEQHDDVEFLPVAPRQFSDYALAQLRTRWGGRGLRAVGVLGLVGASPQGVFKEPLRLKEVSALSEAFIGYVHVLLCDGIKAQKDGFEIAELCNLWQMDDPREA